MKITRRGLLLRAADAIAAALLASTLEWLPAPRKSGIEKFDDAAKYHVGQTVYARGIDGSLVFGEVGQGPMDGMTVIGRVARMTDSTVEIAVVQNDFLADHVASVKHATGLDVTAMIVSRDRPDNVEGFEGSAPFLDFFPNIKR